MNVRMPDLGDVASSGERVGRAVLKLSDVIDYAGQALTDVGPPPAFVLTAAYLADVDMDADDLRDALAVAAMRLAERDKVVGVAIEDAESGQTVRFVPRDQP